MTNSARISDIAFPDVAKGSKIRRKATLTNESGQVVNVTGISSSMGYFSSVFARKVQPNFPVSSTIYFRENEVLQNANGEIATTDQGFGIAGSTDSNGKFAFKPVMLSLSLTAPSAGTSFVYRSDITVEWEASANIPLVNIIIESATGIKTVSNIDASLGTYDAPMIADSGSFDFGQELVITVENSLQTISDSVTVEIRQATLQDFRIEESESEYRVAEDIHFTAYVNYGNLPSIWAVYAQYSSDGITYEDIQSATVGGSGLANITGCLIPAGASGTIYLRARVGDVYSDPIEALVVVPEIVISAVDVTVDVPFTISGTCNLAKNLRISYAKDPYSSWTWVDNSVTVQPNGTWSVGGVVISETGNFRLKAEYIQDTVSMFSDTEDVVVASGVTFLGKYQFNDGDTSSNSDIFDIKYDSDEECFFIAGNTTKNNFYGGGTVNTARANPFIARVEMDGSVTWCKNINMTASTPNMSLSNSTAFRLYLDATRVYHACSVSVDGSQYSILSRMSKSDGGNYNQRIGLSGLQFSQIIGKLGSNLLIISSSGGKAYAHTIADNFTSLTNHTKISSNETSGYSWGAGYPVHARLNSSDTLYFTGLTEQANIQHAKIATVAYSDGAYNMANMTTAITKNTGKNYPLTYHISNDLLRGTGLTQYNADGTHIFENGADNINNGANNVYGSCNKYDTDFYGGGLNISKLTKWNSAWAVQWDKTPANGIFRTQPIEINNDYIAIAGRTTTGGNFDGNNPSNSTLNGIIYVVKKDGTDL